jgi:hypothetical protein
MSSLKFLILIPLLILSSCILTNESPIESSSNAVNLIQSGDIIVSNSGNDSIVLLDSDGNYKSTLVDSQTDATLIYNGLAYDWLNHQILYTHDSTTAALDKVNAISLYDGSVSTVISNNNLSGVLPGLARLTGGELLVLETTTTAEKFLSDNTRSGTPFLNTLTASVADISRLSTGGFVTCSSGTSNTVRTYNAAGVVQATATSASPLPTLGAMASTSCLEDPSGRIVVAYSGATDAVRVYDSTMATIAWTFTDTNVLTTPGKLAVRANGNILITDIAFHHIVEISSAGVLIGTIGGSVLSTPINIVVVP